MNYLSLLVIFFNTQFAWTQNVYGSISGGYQHVINSAQPSSFIVHTWHNITDPWFWREENLKFKDALNLEVNLGHLLNKNIGYELTGSYFKPFDVIESDEYVYRIFTGEFYKSSAKVIFNLPYKKFDFYSKIGINAAFGEVYYYQVFQNHSSLPLSFEESTLKYEYTDGVSIGYNLALGFSKKIKKRFALFGELYSIYQPFEPRKGRIIEQTYDGVEQPENTNNRYYSEIEFGEESQWHQVNSGDNTVPQKLYKRNYSLGGVGLSLGIKFIIWEKKKGRSMHF